MADDETIKIEDKRPAATEKANFTSKYPASVIRAIVQAAVKHDVDPHTALAISLQENALGSADKGTTGIGWGAWAQQPIHSREDVDLLSRYQQASGLAANVVRSGLGKVNKLWDDKDQMREEIRGETGKESTFLNDPGYLRANNEQEYWRDTATKAKAFEEHLPETIAYRANEFVRTLKGKLEYTHKVMGQSIPEDLLIQGYNGLGKIKGSDGRVIDAAAERPYGKRVIALREHAIRNNPEIRKIIDKERKRGLLKFAKSLEQE